MMTTCTPLLRTETAGTIILTWQVVKDGRVSYRTQDILNRVVTLYADTIDEAVMNHQDVVELVERKEQGNG